MKLPIWVHQVATSYAQSALGFDDRPWPFSEVWDKAYDGLDPMSRYDKHAAAITGMASVAERRRMHASEGRGWRPWVVIHGLVSGQTGTSYATREGLLGGQIAVAGAPQGERPVLIVDLEPYPPHFWRFDLMGGQQSRYVDAYLAAFRSAAPTGEIWLSVDARGRHTDEVLFERWWGNQAVTRVLPQVYWTTFRQTPEQALTVALSHLQARSVPASAIAPVLPGDSTPGELTRGIRWVHEEGMLSPSIFQRLNLSPATAEALAELPDPWATSPAPPAFVDPDEARQRIEDAGDALVEVQQVVSSAIADLAAAAAALEERSS